MSERPFEKKGVNVACACQNIFSGAQINNRIPKNCDVVILSDGKKEINSEKRYEAKNKVLNAIPHKLGEWRMRFGRERSDLASRFVET